MTYVFGGMLNLAQLQPPNRVRIFNQNFSFILYVCI